MIQNFYSNCCVSSTKCACLTSAMHFIGCKWVCVRDGRDSLINTSYNYIKINEFNWIGIARIVHVHVIIFGLISVVFILVIKWLRCPFTFTFTYIWFASTNKVLWLSISLNASITKLKFSYNKQFGFILSASADRSNILIAKN